jgi:hypothetical protein
MGPLSPWVRAPAMLLVFCGSVLMVWALLRLLGMGIRPLPPIWYAGAAWLIGAGLLQLGGLILLRALWAMRIGAVLTVVCVLCVWVFRPDVGQFESLFYAGWPAVMILAFWAGVQLWLGPVEMRQKPRC